MATYEVSEVFMSIEGEARYSGHPTVYVRFARCNFQCRGFNNQVSTCPTCRGAKTIDENGGYAIAGKLCSECNGTGVINKSDIQPDGYATLGFDPKDFKTLQSIPLIHKGCDSQYAVNPKFSHMWFKGDEKTLADEVIKVLPHGQFQNPVTGKRVILSLTGGEPTIRLKFWIPLLEELYGKGMRTILVETNCAAPMRDKDLTALYEWVIAKNNGPYPTPGSSGNVKVIWSNSPKLSSSGESWEDAIRPEIAIKQSQYATDPAYPTALVHRMYTEQYFKFVCGPNEEDFAEVAKAMQEYYNAGIPRSVDVYIMPVACTTEQQDEISAQVAKMCITCGYIYCHRIQMIFGNGVGT